MRKPNSTAKQIKFANAAIDALGGTGAVADLFGVDARVVSNWRVRGLPATHFAVMAPMLARLGWDVSPTMFGQRLIDFEKTQAPRQRA